MIKAMKPIETTPASQIQLSDVYTVARVEAHRIRLGVSTLSGMARLAIHRGLDDLERGTPVCPIQGPGTGSQTPQRPGGDDPSTIASPTAGAFSPTIEGANDGTTTGTGRTG